MEQEVGSDASLTDHLQDQRADWHLHQHLKHILAPSLPQSLCPPRKEAGGITGHRAGPEVIGGSFPQGVLREQVVQGALAEWGWGWSWAAGKAWNGE